MPPAPLTPDWVGKRVYAFTDPIKMGRQVLIGHPGADISFYHPSNNEWTGATTIRRTGWTPNTTFGWGDNRVLASATWSFAITEEANDDETFNVLEHADFGEAFAEYEPDVNGYPSCIWHRWWKKGIKEIETWYFAYNDAIVASYNIKNLARLAFQAEIRHADLSGLTPPGNPATDLSGSVEAGSPDVVVCDWGVNTDPNTPTGARFLVIGMSKGSDDPDEIGVNNSYSDARNPFPASSPTTDEPTFVQLAYDSPADGNYAIAVAVDDDKDIAVRRVREALLNHRTWLDRARSDWENWHAPYKALLDDSGKYSDREIYYAVAQLQQIRAHVQGKGYLLAATPNHQYNWVRDTAWAALGAAEYDPELAREMLEWFSNTATTSIVVDQTWFIDGTPAPGPEKPADSAATYLWAVANTWLRSNRLKTFAENVQGQVNNAVDYYLAQWNEADGHIAAEHTHDWMDQYSGLNIVTGDVKYESEIDLFVLNAFGLIHPMLTQLGDTTRAQQVKAIADRLHDTILEDYKVGTGEFGEPDTYLAYAIKNDDSLYDDGGLIAMATHVWAGLFYKDRRFYDFLVHRETQEKMLRDFTAHPYATEPQLANMPKPMFGRPYWSDTEPGTLTGRSELWWQQFFAILDGWWGAGTAMHHIINMHVTGQSPVWTAGQTGAIVGINKFDSFPWSCGTGLYMLRTLARERASTDTWVTVEALRDIVGSTKLSEMGFSDDSDRDAFLQKLITYAQSHVAQYMRRDYTVLPEPTTTLTDDFVAGATAIKVDDADGFFVDDVVQVGLATGSMLAVIDAITGTESPFTVTLDRGLNRPYETGEALTAVRGPVYYESASTVPAGVKEGVLRLAANLWNYAVANRRGPVFSIDNLELALNDDEVFSQALRTDLNRFRFHEVDIIAETTGAVRHDPADYSYLHSIGRE